MTKINSLLNYLIKNSFYKEASYLFKLANNQISEKEMKTRFPKIWAAYQNFKTPHFVAWAQLTVSLINKPMTDEAINALIINNFKDLKEAVSGKKTDPRKEFLEEVKKEVEVNISDEELLYAKEKGLTPEETIFLAKDETAHPFLIKVDWAFKFNQNKHKHEDLKDKKITNYQNIDEVDKAISDKITYSAEYMKDFYKGIESKAEETSKVIYNSLNYVVAHSKSKEAAQWWEQSCVSYNSKTKTVDAGLCTARHEGNLYDEYYSDGYLVQIITKPDPSSSPSPETNFRDKNYSWNLISLHILDDGELSQEHGSTVNRLNQDVTPCEIKDALGDEYNKIIEAISNYFNKNFNTQISGFYCKKPKDAPNILKLIKKDELNERDINFLYLLPAEDYFNYKLDIKFKEKYPKIFDENYRNIAEFNLETYFENNLGKYRNEKPEYLKIFKNILEELLPEEYFAYKLDKKYGEEFPFINISKHTSEEYFEKDFDEKYPETLEGKLNELSPGQYFAYKLDEKYKRDYLNIFERNLNEINSNSFFVYNLDEKYRNEKPEYFKTFEDKLNKISPWIYFQYKLDEKYGEEFSEIFKRNLNKINYLQYFDLKLDQKYRDENKEYLEIFKRNLNEIHGLEYFEFKLDEEYAESYPLIHISKHTLLEYFEKKFDEKYPEGLPKPDDGGSKFYDYPDNALIPIKDLLKELYPEDYFRLKLDERYKEYTDILEKNLKEINGNKK